MGAQGSAAAAGRQGAATGRYLRKLGIDVDLAPVLDASQSSGSFLGSRSFGSDPGLVARVGGAFATGLQSARVAATAKHFPGLGTAGANTDDAAVTIGSSRAELMRLLQPFRKTVRSGTKLVMVSNASYPALDASGLPASISPGIVNNLLRKELGFGGVVITDAISAPGPASYRDAPVRAVNAGVDIVLFPGGEDLSAAGFRSLVRAARSGELSRATLQRSYGRVLALKDWLHESAPAKAKRPARSERAGIATAVRTAAPYTAAVLTLNPALRAKMTGVSWHPGCPVPLGDLRLVSLSYWGFDHKVHRGRLVVNRDATRAVVRVFHQLYDRQFPIRQMVLVDQYGGSDFESIEADNTSAFNCRPVAGSTRWSQHAYGRAIDVNPIENPYVYASGTSSHTASRPYLDRSLHQPGTAYEGGTLVVAFDSVGWGWGGRWSGEQDYQHFSSTGS